MPFAYNDGVKIRYDVEGTGPPLVLYHGFGGFLETWYGFGYVELLKDKYLLILMDARGSGGSDKPHDVHDYALSKRVADVVAVLDALGIETAHFFGYSMGGYIGWGIPKYAPKRFRSVILGGGGPAESTADTTDTEPNYLQQEVRKGLDSWVQFVMSACGEYWSPEWEPALRATDLMALDAKATSFEGISYDQVLKKMTLPCMIMVGTNDAGYASALAASQVIPGAEFVALEGFDHADGLGRIDVTIPHITRFIDKVEQSRTVT